VTMLVASGRRQNPPTCPLAPDVRLCGRWFHPEGAGRGEIAVGAAAARHGGTVAVFGDSVAWTMMRYLPPGAGTELHQLHHHRVWQSPAAGPYRYVGETLNQKPECDAWPSRWSQRINHDRPDVVLLMVGPLGDRGPGSTRGTGRTSAMTRFDAYLRGELQRALDILTSTGGPCGW